MRALPRIPRPEVGEQPPPDNAIIDVHVLGLASLSLSVSARMSRPDCQATPQEYAGHLVGSTAVGAPIDRTPSGTYSIFNIRIKADDSTLTFHPPFLIAS
jgi:hypothetical protein